MADNANDLRGRLEDGFFVSSMMGITDGAFCARASKGCAMVQLGAYLAEPTASAEEKGRDARSFLPADREACAHFLDKECRQATSLSDVAICMNLAAPKLEWGLEAAERFAQAGGDRKGNVVGDQLEGKDALDRFEILDRVLTTHVARIQRRFGLEQEDVCLLFGNGFVLDASRYNQKLTFAQNDVLVR